MMLVVLEMYIIDDHTFAAMYSISRYGNGSIGRRVKIWMISGVRVRITISFEVTRVIREARMKITVNKVRPFDILLIIDNEKYSSKPEVSRLIQM
jgi:hypothetical protein